jgi:putative glycosyltransferase (TIGR04348 family)
MSMRRPKDRVTSALIVTPAPAGTRLGNRITAQRWQRILRELGLRARVARAWRGEDCDLLVALHAHKSAASVRAFRAAHPARAIVVALTGTDVYAPRGVDAISRSSIERADRVVVLQPEAMRALDPRSRRKARVIFQSAERANARSGLRSRASGAFEVVALGHLRAVKDPLLAALAARMLPASSRARIDHYGAGLDERLVQRARRESETNARWSWRGERSHAQILAILARANAFVQTSRAEGGSSAMSEAIVARLPILATRIPGAVGMLGRDHRGYFEVGDARGLARLLERCEHDARFRSELQRASARHARLFTKARELAAWRALLRELELA